MTRLVCLLIPLAALGLAGDERPRTDLHGDPLPDGVRVRCGTTRLRHYHEPKAEFSRDGKTLRTTSSQGEVVFWDVATGKRLRELKGPDGDLIHGTALSPDGKLLAGTGPKGVYLWDADTLRLVKRLADTSGDAVAWLPDGKAFVTSGIEGDGDLVVWDAATGKEERRLKGDWHFMAMLVPAADGKTVVLSATDSSLAVVWDATTGKRIGQLPVPNFYLSIAVPLPDGNVLLAGGGRRVEGRRVGLASVRDPRTGKEVRTLPALGEFLSGAVLSPDGKTLFASERDGPIRALDLATGAELANWPAGGVIRAVSPDGKVVAAAVGESAVHLWDAATGKALHDRPGHDGWVNAVAFTPDGKSVVSAVDRRDVRVWDAATGKQRYRLVPPEEKADGWDGFAALGGRMLSGGGGDVVRVWDAATGEPARPIAVGEGQRLVAVAAVGGGKQLACVGQVPVGQDQSRLVVSLVDPATGKAGPTWDHFLPGRGVFTPVLAVAPDGGRIAIPQRVEAGIALRDLATGKNPATIDPDGETYLVATFSPDGQTLAVNCVTNAEPRKFHVRLYDAATGKERKALPVAGIGWSAAFAPSGRTLAVVEGHHVRLLDVATGKDVWRSPKPTSGLVSLAFSPDGKSLASGMMDGTVLLWDVPTR